MKQIPFNFRYVMPYDWLLIESRKNLVRDLVGRLYTLNIRVLEYDVPRYKMFIVEERH